MDFSAFSAWGTFNIVFVILASMLVGNILKKTLPPLRKSLIPTSVLGGLILLVVSSIYYFCTGDQIFDTAIFGGKGMAALEVITYHALALGFVASALKTNGGKIGKKRTIEVFNTGVSTVSTYLLQGILGLGITLIVALIVPNFFGAAGMLLPFGFGQGTGQALNYGTIYQTDHGFTGGASFGLAVAALCFLSASLGGVVCLNIRRARGKLVISKPARTLRSEDIESPDEIPMQESVDKLTLQVALIALAYFITWAIMFGLSQLLPGMTSLIYGFNFLIGVLSATLVKLVLNFLRKKNIVKKEYTNNFLLTRTSNFFFDIMVVAGIAAIQVETILNYWGVLLILGVVGAVFTYIYQRFISKRLFPEYAEEQFLMMYGMLTGTASTGIILLREIDGNFETPAADNMVYQNFPAIVFGLPMMFLATLAPERPILTLIVLVAFFAAMNILLFRSLIFGGKRKKKDGQAPEDTAPDNTDE